MDSLANLTGRKSWSDKRVGRTDLDKTREALLDKRYGQERLNESDPARLERLAEQEARFQTSDDDRGHLPVAVHRTLFVDGSTKLGSQTALVCRCSMELVVKQKLDQRIRAAFDAAGEFADARWHWRGQSLQAAARSLPTKTRRVRLDILRLEADQVKGRLDLAYRPRPDAPPVAIGRRIVGVKGSWLGDRYGETGRLKCPWRAMPT